MIDTGMDASDSSIAAEGIFWHPQQPLFPACGTPYRRLEYDSATDADNDNDSSSETEGGHFGAAVPLKGTHSSLSAPPPPHLSSLSRMDLLCASPPRIHRLAGSSFALATAQAHGAQPQDDEDSKEDEEDSSGHDDCDNAGAENESEDRVAMLDNRSLES